MNPLKSCLSASLSLRVSALSLVACAFLPVGIASAQTPGYANQATTAVSLTVTANGAPVSTLPVGNAVVLTASVAFGGHNLTQGVIRFCDSSVAPRCTHENKIGHAQLTQAGSASMSYTPGPGQHSYTAVFYPQIAFLSQSSAASGLNVTAVGSSTTTVAQTGTLGNYTLTATITGKGNGALLPTGNVNFLDTTLNNQSLGTAPLVSAAAALAFTSSVIPTGLISTASSVATGDFNHDGKVDIAAIGSDSHQATILLGNGDGSFTATTTAPTSLGGVYQIKVADFNRDGNLDLAMVNIINNEVDLWFGKGDGTFTQGPAIVGGFGPIALGVADLNGDGILDLLRVNTYAGSVTFLAGKGDGTFTASPDMYVSWQNPTIPVVADFNGDGIQDFAVVVLNGAAMVTYLGKGDGTFAQAQYQTVGDHPSFIVAGDFNGDGNVDLALTNKGDSTVSVLLGKGDGTFTAKQTIPTPAGTIDLAVGDFNQDGVQDLVVSSGSSNLVTLLTGKGDGTFTTSISSTAGTNPYQLAVADFNGDGLPDVALANDGSSVAVVLTQGSRKATATLTGVLIPGVGLQSVAAKYQGDLNFNSSLSNVLSLQGASHTTKMSLYPSTNFAWAGQQVGLTADVSPSAAASTTNNGENVSFYANGQAIGAAALRSGSATLNVAHVPAGFYVVTSSYAGDATFSAAQAVNYVFVFGGWWR